MTFSKETLVLYLVMATTCLGTSQTFAQPRRSETGHAVNVLKSSKTDRARQRNVTAWEEDAANGSPYAMHKLGLAYAGGRGVECDSAKAVYWLEKVGNRGYVKAYHELGFVFKYPKCGMRQDFERAYHYFCIGAKRGSVACIYDKGFMLYKGLGCKQDYKNAVKCFKTAANRGSKPSLYMLGLCYRNGYGVGKNLKKAYKYLKRSAALGYRDAREELERSNEETYLHEAMAGSPDYSYVTSKTPDVPSMVNDTGMIAGNYHGYLVMYDWSGQFLLGEKPLTMSVNKKWNGVDGFIVIGVDTVPFHAKVTSDNRLKFEKGSVKLRERYSHSHKANYRMEDMVFDAWNDKICGRLNLYSLTQQEPERPMYFELSRNEVNSGTNGRQHEGVNITPNPFKTTFTATFELQNDSDVQVWVFNTSGMMEWQKDLGHLETGRHEIALSPDIRPGKYIMNIKAGRQNLHAIIIKK